MFKKTQCIMLSSIKEAKILFNPSNNKLTTRPREWSIEDCITIGYQTNDLYFLSDEEIKEVGVYGYLNGEIGYTIKQYDKLCFHIPSKNGRGSLTFPYPRNFKDEVFKIIISTDKSLGLPRPSDSFIKKYCELGGINEAMVEYNENKTQYRNGINIQLYLKIAPDNTITIKAVKDSWNREEMIEFAKKAYDEGYENGYDGADYAGGKYRNEWIEENL